MVRQMSISSNTLFTVCVFLSQKIYNFNLVIMLQTQNKIVCNTKETYHFFSISLFLTSNSIYHKIVVNQIENAVLVNPYLTCPWKKTGPEIINIFMLNSTEHDISTALKC